MSQEHTDAVELVGSETVAHLSGAVLIAALTAVLAQFSIDLPGGLPFSFQPFGVFVAGILLGPLWGGFSLLLYLLVGIAGAPVFSNGAAGVGIVTGPTGGFLVSFVIAAALIGAVAHRSIEPKPVSGLAIVGVTAGLVVGMAVTYAVGLPWFAEVQGWTLSRTASFMAPFAVGDAVKIAITVSLVANGNELLEWR
jgi:biotin transport system substrate-specific component